MIVHILKMYIFYFVHVSFFFSFLRGVEPKTVFSSEMLRGCQVYVICNSKSFHCFLYKLCLMFVHILKINAYFVHV